MPISHLQILPSFPDLYTSSATANRFFFPLFPAAFYILRTEGIAEEVAGLPASLPPSLPPSLLSGRLVARSPRRNESTIHQ
jgi:hypothetical protein